METDATATIVDVGANVTLALVKNARNKYARNKSIKISKIKSAQKLVRIYKVF